MKFKSNLFILTHNKGSNICIAFNQITDDIALDCYILYILTV